MNEMVTERRASNEVRHMLDDLFSMPMSTSENELASSGLGLADNELKGASSI